MGHEITERTDGTAEAAFALTPAWHGLGTVLDHPMTSAEALKTAQLDWEVVQRQLALHTPGSVGDIPDKYEDIPNLFGNVRSDNGLFLGAVSDRYKVVQNVDAFEFMDEIISEGEMTYESAFSLRGGKDVVLLGRLPKVDEIVSDDVIQRYILMSLYHDGTGSIHFGPCSTRVVCANTHAVAVQEESVKQLSIRHTGDIKTRMNEARAILGMANDQFEHFAQVGRELAQKKFTTDMWTRFLDVMCPELSTDDPDYTPRRATAISKTRDQIVEAYHNERQMISGIEESAWSAYNSVTEHIDHLPRRGATRAKKAEARFNTCFYGAGRDMKQRALEAACRIAGVDSLAV